MTSTSLSVEPDVGLPASLRILFDAEVDALTWTPDLVHKVSAWWKHVPFAFWLMSVAKPRVFVELGSHNGISYAAFCQAVARQGLDTRCYAVDTWEGDEQAGHYSEAAYTDLSALNAERYAAFSDLLRMTFDEACDTFEDGTIDLLHIDGLHTYEAVSHDFETWQRKLSPRGVVLFHDTNVRKATFGVHKLFGEVSKGVPHFEFLHGHGLGVLAKGPDAPTVVKDLCVGLSDAQILAVRERFCRLGTYWHDSHELRRRLAKAEVAGQGIVDRFVSLADRRGDPPKRGLLRGKRAEPNPDVALIRRSLYFDAAWYLRENPEVARSGVDPATHYLEVGGFEGCEPGPLFSTEKYAFEAGLEPGKTNALLHFLQNGGAADFAALVDFLPYPDS